MRKERVTPAQSRILSEFTKKMDYFDEFYDKRLCQFLVNEIKKELYFLQISDPLVFMEVCGTHTMAIHRNGIKEMIPGGIRLISGPGCPVCVTPNREIDQAIAFARLKGVCVATFGDMIKVPGSSSSLEREKEEGWDIRVVYSPLDALRLAEENPHKKIVFLGIGFETTAPAVAASIKDAKEKNVKNYFVMSMHKLIPPAIKAIIDANEVKINGFLLPGHVSTIIGSKSYEFIPKDYGISCAVAGFEPLDILQAIFTLLQEIRYKSPRVENCYSRSVKENGNPKAKELMEEVFEVCDAEWRGLGFIPKSGLKIREEYTSVDALKNIETKIEETKDHPGCICGSILRGVNTPLDCDLFGKFCTPQTPVGPCMVSSEGTCAAYYKYGHLRIKIANE